MFFRKKTESENIDGYGRLYVMRFEFPDGLVLHKVGMCNTNRTLDRMMEILRSFFVVNRFIPNVKIRKDKKVVVPLLVEQHMHSLLEEFSFEFDDKFDGSTEFFYDLDEEAVLDYLDSFDYRELMKGVTKMKVEDLEAIKKEIDPVIDDNDELPF